MKSIRVKKPFEVEIYHQEKPVLQNGYALIKLLYGGICGSDLGTYRGTFAYTDYPRIPGHEFSAEVIDICSDEPTTIQKGMIVTANPYINCGTCYSCKRGLVNACESNKTLGCQIDGLFSEYAVVPIDRIYDGQGINPKELALVEPYCISAHGVSKAHIKKGETVLIIGAGTIGTLAAIAALKEGAIVYMTDISLVKLDFAKRVGIHGVILNNSPEFLLKEAMKVTEGRGFDVTIEAVGLPQTFQSCIDTVCFGGRVVVIGVGKKNLDFNFTIIQKKELNIYGSRNALKKDFLDTILAIKDGKLNLLPLITHEYALDQAINAFQDFDKHGDQMLKVMIHF